MAVSDTTKSNDIFSTVRTVIYNASPTVTDTSGTHVAPVYAKYNDKQTNTPQIVIESSTTTEGTYKFSSTQGKKLINISASCYYNTPKGCDSLGDQITNAVKTAVDNGTIQDIELVGVSEDVAFINPDEMKFHLKTITFTFDKE